MSSSSLGEPRTRNTELLPIEIWQEIFALACTDGGYTGRSLSLVSRSIHDAAEAVRYRSISVIGAAQYRGFALLLEQRADRIPTQIHHLFISNVSNDSERLDEWRDNESRTIWEPHHLCCPLLANILAAVAPQLRTLTVYHCGIVTFRILPPAIQFPMLAELTCVFGDREWALYDANVAPPLPLPALRRLHMIHCWQSLHPLNVSTLTRALTHLRFSEGYASFDDDLPTYLMSLMGQPITPTAVSPAHPEDQQRPAAPLPPSVRRVVVHTQPTQASAGAPLDLHGEMLYELEHIAKDDPAQRLRVLEDDFTVGRRLEAARADWADRQEGRAGCWELPDPLVNEPYRCVHRRNGR